MKWATREQIHVDRAGSAWLITTYLDDDAKFVYVTDIDEVPDEATAFDMVGCELSHHGDDVTFETILRRYQLDDPILWRLAEIIHQADLEDDKFNAPEATGLDVVIRALSHHRPDEEVRRLTSALFDSLYAYLRDQALGPTAPR